MEIKTGVAFTQWKGCWFCLHVGSVAFFFGERQLRTGPRLELFTPLHLFRWSRGD